MSRFVLIAMAASAALFDGCAARSPSLPIIRGPPVSILAGSSPAPGATVREPIDTLTLRFDPPARLDELTVTGAEGTMPMMVHSAGEVRDYSIPLSGLQYGTYTVEWRATRQGRDYRGRFSFTVDE